MLTCYVLINSLWLEIYAPDSTVILNVDTINMLSTYTTDTNTITIITNNYTTKISIENVTLESFKNCIAEAEAK